MNTFFHNENCCQTIYIPVHLNQEDLIEYKEEYEKYREWYLNKLLPFKEPKRERIKQLRSGKNILSQEELEDAYSNLQKPEFQVVASVSVSAKIVDVKSGEIIWLGQGATNDFTLVGATQRILEKFIEFIQSQEGQTIN